LKQIHFRIGALFLLSVSIIGFELAVMRSFSVGSWSNFGSTVISIALLGFGLAGTIAVFIQKHIRQAPNAWLATLSLLCMPAIALAHVLAQRVPFNPIMIASDWTQLIWIGAYYLVYSVPFFLGALFINVAFIAMSSRIHALYFWNMAGSGLGGFFILGCMYLFPPDTLVLPLIVVSFLTTLFCYVRFSSRDGRLWIEPRQLFFALAALSVSVSLILTLGEIKVSEFKGVSYARKFPDSRLDYRSYSPMGEMHVYSSSYFHFAPGLSDVAALNLDEMPKNAFKGLYIDGGGPIGIMRELDGEERGYIDFLPMSAPYLLLEKPRVLLVKLGGGISAFTALHHGAEAVHILESNPDLIYLLGQVPEFVEYNGGLLNDQRVEIIEGEPRSYTARSDERFDLVEISLIDSVGLSQAGGYPVDENYTYTVEAISDYMKCLDDDGILSITVWNKLSPPRNVPKLLSTVIGSLMRQGVETPEKRVFVFNLLLSTATVLVKNSDFTAHEIATLRDFCRKMSFEVSYYPAMPDKDKDFEAILGEYWKLYSRPSSKSRAQEADNTAGPANLLPQDLYHFSLKWLLSGRKEDLFRGYVFNIRQATDSRPYYTAYLKPLTVGMFLDQIGEISEEWGYLLLLATLGVSVLFGLFIVLIPIIGRWRDLFRGKRGTLGIIVYYACLGMGYMLVEIFLIQRLVYFLADPIFSASIVITSMLIISGLGSLYASRYKDRAFIVRIAVAGIAASLLFYIFALSPLINALIGLPLAVKLFVAVLFIAPAAFFMGMPFPSGLSSLESSRPRLLPWALGMNGALSVTGAVAAKLISISYGFPAVLILVIVLYVIVTLVYKTNEQPAEE
jgi:spermidine synthase